ncbi:DUF6294 family protein [Streptomyces olivoreticuli]|uniref:DUF6294 family protein n=1 Tax=Streptomyces olivoreticuli TaxID=68246 RepID=UPI000E22C3C4|nr:DUF6294 family protein [Streptomyces olivoreticuli]
MKSPRRAIRTLLAAAVLVTAFAAPAAAVPADTDPAASGTVRQGIATDYKWWTWGDLSAGDCHQTGGELRLYSDGKLTFTAKTQTTFTLSGDIWHARFGLKNTSGQELYRTTTYDSPTMWPSKWYDMNAQGTFEPSVYAATAQVTQYYSC